MSSEETHSLRFKYKGAQKERNYRQHGKSLDEQILEKLKTIDTLTPQTPGLKLLQTSYNLKEPSETSRSSSSSSQSRNPEKPSRSSGEDATHRDRNRSKDSSCSRDCNNRDTSDYRHNERHRDNTSNRHIKSNRGKETGKADRSDSGRRDSGGRNGGRYSGRRHSSERDSTSSSSSETGDTGDTCDKSDSDEDMLSDSDDTSSGSEHDIEADALDDAAMEDMEKELQELKRDILELDAVRAEKQKSVERLERLKNGDRKHCRKGQRQTLLIHDGIARDVDDVTSLTEIGFPGATFKTLTQEVETNVDLKYKITQTHNVIVHVGTYDIHTMEAADYPSALNILIAAIKEINRPVVCFYSAMLPRMVDFDQTETLVKRANNRVRCFCKYRKIEMFKTFRPFVRKNSTVHRHMFNVFDDGLHPNKEGSRVLSNFYMQAVKRLRNEKVGKKMWKVGQKNMPKKSSTENDYVVEKT